MPSTPDTARHRRRGQLALGFACIFGLFILETRNADRVSPNAASPYIWGVLVAAAIVCLAYSAVCFSLARRGAEEAYAPIPPESDAGSPR